MKNLTKLLSVVLIMALSPAAYGQIFGVKAGFSFSDMMSKYDGEEEDDIKMKSGFHIGPTVEFSVNENFAVETGLLFTTKGAKGEASESYQSESYSYETKINLYYLDVPVYAKFSTVSGNTKIYGLAGPYLGCGLIGKIKTEETYNGESDSYEEDIEWGSGDDNHLKRLDFGVGLGAGVEIKSIALEAVYNLGLANISAYSDEDIEVKNRVFMVSLAYIFHK